MRTYFFALLLALPLMAQAAPPPKAFSADYDLFQNDRRLGTGTVRFQPLGNGQWEAVSTSQATRGLASAAGARRNERSVLRWDQGRVEVVSYQMDMRAAWTRRNQSLVVDAEKRTAVSTDRGQVFDLVFEPGMVDRHSVTIAIMAELAAGARDELRFAVADRREVDQHRYRVDADVTLQTALGSQRAVRVERIRDDDSGRRTLLWFGKDKHWIPLRIKQYEENGESVDMRITRIR
jgi:hypothetical protein